jgi:hypothetical protein
MIHPFLHGLGYILIQDIPLLLKTIFLLVLVLPSLALVLVLPSLALVLVLPSLALVLVLVAPALDHSPLM